MAETRRYEALGFEFELNWDDQTCTILRYPGTVPVIPISLIALILQRFGGFRVALNPNDWKGIELKNNVKLPESGGSS